MFDENKILGQDESYGKGPVRIFGGGDSASWHGVYTYLGYDYRSFSDLFEIKNGGYARHPTEGYSSYYKHPWDGRISRDQLTGIIAALIGQRDRKALLRVFLHHGAWLWLFAYNTRKNGDLSYWKIPDPTGPDIWALYIRGFLLNWAWLAMPVLTVLDIHNLLNGLLQRKTKTPHSMNYIVKMLISIEYGTTVISWLTAKINSIDSLLSSLREFFCGWRGNCFMVRMFYEKMKKEGVK